ncbi:hypothetical protein NMY22_g16431 [Coprinellus aureogranulatus]|nr:hypothetical protein NMY22_g16431 [Coprinellus aureogranulatus]
MRGLAFTNHMSSHHGHWHALCSHPSRSPPSNTTSPWIIMQSNSPFEQYYDTDYVPTPSQRGEIDAVIEEHRVMLDGIDAQLEELDRLRSELEEKRTFHSKVIARHHNLTSSVRAVPTDILTIVFLTLLTVSDQKTRPHPSVAVSHVCHQWRRLALGIPFLWNHISVSTPTPGPDGALTSSLWMTHIISSGDRAKAFMDRSSNVPLHVALSAQDPLDISVARALLPETLDEHGGSFPWGIEDKLLGKKDVVESMSLILKVNPLAPLCLELLCMLQVPMKALVVEMAYVKQASFPSQLLAPIEKGLDLRESPCLRRLTLKMGFNDLHRIKANWNALTELTLDPGSNPVAILSPSHVMSIITKTTNLERLTFEFSHVDMGLGGIMPPAYPQVHLRKLKSLTIRGNGLSLSFVESLTIPSITHLCVMPNLVFSPEDERASALLALIQRYGHQLIDIAFNYQMVTPDTLLLVVKGMPNVEVLELSTFDRPVVLVPGIPVLDSVIAKLVSASELESEGDEAEPPLCPKMRRFSCNLHATTAEVKQSILNLVESRRRGGRQGRSNCWLEEINVRFDVGSVDGMMDDLRSRGIRTSCVNFSVREGGSGVGV